MKTNTTGGYAPGVLWSTWKRGGRSDHLVRSWRPSSQRLHPRGSPCLRTAAVTPALRAVGEISKAQSLAQGSVGDAIDAVPFEIGERLE